MTLLKNGSRFVAGCDYVIANQDSYAVDSDFGFIRRHFFDIKAVSASQARVASRARGAHLCAHGKSSGMDEACR